jgi:hypothetical protein
MDKEWVITVLLSGLLAVGTFVVTGSGFAGVVAFFGGIGAIVFGVLIGDEIGRRLHRYFSYRNHKKQ